MKKSLIIIAASVALTTLSGCIVVPARGPGGPEAYSPPPGVVYVAPDYASPGVGYAWEYHPRYGWGWHSRQYGWHRGWR